MPKRPSKKAMEAVVDPLWAVENQTMGEFDEVEDIQEAEEGEEGSSLNRVRAEATERASR